MKFSTDKVAFGRHETFALRYSWLAKGFHALQTDSTVFDNDDSVVALGVGRNMVSSIRYWLRASQLITPQKPDEPTEIGKLIFDINTGRDPYMEDEATIWLLHWLLATNSNIATSLFWFFNKFHKPEFTSEELQAALSDFINDQVAEKKRPSASTIKKDALLMTRMYSQSKASGRTPLEEALDSPLSLLGLISQSSAVKSYQFKPKVRPNLPTGIFAFAASQLMHEHGDTAIPIEDLMYSRNNYAALGSTFRLTEAELITKLELMVSYLPGYFEIRETAGIHQLYQIRKIDPLIYLEKHYDSIEEGVAA